MISYQILQLNEDHLSVGAQDFFVVTFVFTVSLGQHEEQQGSAEQSSGQTLSRNKHFDKVESLKFSLIFNAADFYQQLRNF